MTIKWSVALILVPIYGFGLINLLSPKGDSVSEIEKRDKASLPAFTANSFFKGHYTRDLDNFFSDHFAFRDSIVKWGGALKEWRGMNGEDDASIVSLASGDNTGGNVAKAAPPPPLGEEVAASSSTQSTSNETMLAEDEGQQIDKYLVLKDRAMLLYHFRPVAADNYAKVINRIQASVDPKVTVYSMLVPSAVEFIENEKYKKLSSSEKEAFQYTYSKYNQGVHVVDAYSEIEKHKKEYVYFRSDHHWTALGAYYAYTAFMRELGQKPVPLTTYKTGKIDGYLGSAYSATLVPAIKANPDTIIYYIPKDTYKYTLHTSGGKTYTREVVNRGINKATPGSYAVFLGGDYPLGEITTKQKNGKRLLILKDSYSNPFIPFLIPHFEAIYFIDIRSYKSKILDFVKLQKITTILVENSPIVTSNSLIADLINTNLDQK